MQLEMPIFECPEDAIKSLVQALGGNKTIGAQLWPDKTVDNASRLLNDCLNTSRAEKLDISQVMMILSQAKKIGHHTAFNWMAGEIGYEAKAITTAEELDRVTLVVEQSTKTLTFALATLERIQQNGR